MNRQIIFTPEKEASRDLTYSEHSSCQQSIHILLQDKGVQNYEFLLKAYRSAISSYLSCHKIESPVTFLRNLTTRFDELARECRVLPDDYSHIGMHILFSTGKMFWLLSSDESTIFFGTESGYTPLAGMPEDALSELPAHDAEAQTELFPSSLKDFLRLYAIPVAGRSDVVLGCGEQQKHTVLDNLETLAASGAAPGTPLKQYLPLKYLDRKVMVISLAAYADKGASPLPEDIPVVLAGSSHRSIPVLALYVVIIVIVAVGTIWGVSRLTSRTDSADLLMESGMETGSVSATGGEAEPAGSATPAPPEEERGSILALSPVWDRSFPDAVTSSPALSGGRVMFGCRDGNLYSLDCDNGEVAWKYASGAGIGASPVVAGEQVICANYGGEVFCCNTRDGSRLWRRTLPGKISSSPCVSGRLVLVGCYDTVVYALSLESGEIAWKFDTGAIIRATPVANGEIALVASYDGYLYALSPETGREVWRYRVEGAIDSSPVLDAGQVYIGGADGSIHALDGASGEVRWKVAPGGPVKSGLTLDRTHLFAGSNDGSLYCVNRENGAVAWNFTTGGLVLAKPAIGAGMVVVASYDGSVYIINSDTGERIDSFASGDEIYSSPCIDTDRIYFGNNAGSFYCVRYLQRTAS